MTGDEVLKLYREERDILDRWFTKARSKLGRKPACKAGCMACCKYDQPPLGAWEAFALAYYAQQTPGLEDVLERCVKDAEQIVEMAEKGVRSIMRYGSELQSCPFLDQSKGTCRIYSMRPSACVFAYSESRERCDTSVERLDEDVGWTVDTAEQQRILERMWRMLPTDTKERFKVTHRWRASNGGGLLLMLSLAIAAQLRPDIRERLLKLDREEQLAGVR